MSYCPCRGNKVSVLSPSHIQPSPSLPFSSSGRDSARLRIERFEARLLGARAFPPPTLQCGHRPRLPSILPLPVPISPHSSSFFILLTRCSHALSLSLSLSLSLPLLYDFASRRVRFNPPFAMPLFVFPLFILRPNFSLVFRFYVSKVFLSLC